MAYGTLASDLTNILGSSLNQPAGKIDAGTAGGKQATPGSGPKHQPGMSSAQVAAAVVPPKAPQAPRPKAPQAPRPKAPRFSANNPMMGVQPPPIPHPGVSPPYPDARSPQPTMLPNGQVLMPPPKGFPLGSAGVRVPPSFTPGMTGLLGR